MSIFVERYLGRTQAVEGMVENWKIKHDQAMFVMDLEEMIRECLDLSSLCQHAWKTLWQLLRRDPNGDAVDEAEEPLKKALAKTLQIFQSVQDLVAEAKVKEFTIQNAEALATAAQDVREISAKIGTVFPELNKEMAEASLAEFERGEYQTIEDLIREIQGHNAPAH